ncbi:MAG: hypothetical protein MUO22_03275 [Sedimentisphaerales bacterium]|nr:hypothetical protein [Sedimentisphaerales bacterium]
MRKNLLCVLAAVLLTAMIFSTATAGTGIPTPDELGPCVCDDREDFLPLPDGDWICDNCDRPIPRGDGDADGEPDQDQIGDGSCED